MPSDSSITALLDMRYNIDLAVFFVKDFNRKSFCDDLRTIYAVTRCLEIISEASRRIPESIKEKHPSIAWKQIAGAGNVYRHDYEDVIAHYVWDTVQVALAPLKAVIVAELGEEA